MLLAESFSGPAAILAAASNPPGLAGVILCASFAQCPRPVLRYLSPLLSLISTVPIPKFLLRGLFLGRFATPTLLEDLAHAVAAIEKDVLRGRLSAVIDVDVTDEVIRVPVPALPGSIGIGAREGTVSAAFIEMANRGNHRPPSVVANGSARGRGRGKAIH